MWYTTLLTKTTAVRRARVRSLLRRVEILRMRPFPGDDKAEEEVGPVQLETSRRRDKWDDVGHPVRAGRKDAMTTRSQRRITRWTVGSRQSSRHHPPVLDLDLVRC